MFIIFSIIGIELFCKIKFKNGVAKNKMCIEIHIRCEYNVNIELFYMDLFIKCKKAFI